MSCGGKKRGIESWWLITKRGDLFLCVGFFLSHCAEPPPNSRSARRRFRERLPIPAGQIVQLIIQIVNPL